MKKDKPGMKEIGGCMNVGGSEQKGHRKGSSGVTSELTSPYILTFGPMLVIHVLKTNK